MKSITPTSIALQNSVFMARVYQWMSIGILLTGIVAYLVGTNEELIEAITGNPISLWLMIIAQFGIVIGLARRVDTLRTGTAQFLFLLYSVITGITFSVIFLVYSLSNIQSAFFTTAAAFLGLSFFGYITKRDLGPIGSFCLMGLFGMIAYSLLSLFFPVMMGGSAGLTYSAIGLLVFSGLTAYDTQKIKEMGQMDSANMSALSILGALTLYLDFINLFLLFLQFSSNRKRRWI